MAPLRRIVVASFGSRGDIQPYVALALGLQKRGYEVFVSTNEDHVVFVQEFGLECSAGGLPCQQFMEESPEVQKAMAEGDFMAFIAAGKNPAFTDATVSVYLPKFIVSMNEFKPDLAIFGSLSGWYMSYSIHVMRVPTMHAALQWVMASPGRTPFGLPHLPFGLNRVVVDKILLGGLYDIDVDVDRRMAKENGTPAMYNHFFDVKVWLDTTFKVHPFETIVAQAPQVADVLYDKALRPKNISFTGPWVLEPKEQLQAVNVGHSKTLPFGEASNLMSMQKFMAAGSKPVYMGWGSMTCKSPDYMCRLAVGALKSANARGIILGGFAGLGSQLLDGDAELKEYAESNVLFVKKVPHEWLFPHCSCLVHHGGAGTTNVALRSGVPQIITPIFLDQFDHAYLVNQLAIGIGTKQFQKLRPAELGKALKDVLSSPTFAANAAEVAKAESNGVDNAVDRIEVFWKEEGETGRFIEYFDKQRRDFVKKKQESCCFSCAR